MPPGFKAEKHSLMAIGILWNGNADKVKIWQAKQNKHTKSIIFEVLIHQKSLQLKSFQQNFK